jgi:hypothetical protein
MRKYKTLILSGKGYPVYAFTPLTTKRVITALRGLNVSELKSMSDGAEITCKAISYAVTGSGIFSRIRSFLLYRRFIRRASLDELITALQTVIEMMPVNEYYTVSLITNQFNKLVSR